MEGKSKTSFNVDFIFKNRFFRIIKKKLGYLCQDRDG